VACPQWHCRAWARAWVESGPGCQDLVAGTLQRLEALPDPRSPQGRIYPGSRQAIKITRWRQDATAGKTTRQIVYAITSLTSAHATAQDPGPPRP
jgi:hypothetical protein